MKFRLLPFFLIAAMTVFVACSDDDDDNGPVTPDYDIVVSDMVPISGPIGSDVRIKGSNFGTDPAEMNITFGGIAVTPVSMTDTEITIRVPADLPIGTTSILVQRQTGKIVTLQFTVEDPIVGKWLSEGTDVAPLLYNPPFNIRSIEATFKSDGSYIVVQTDSSDVSSTLTGSYVTADGGAAAPNDGIRMVTVNQGSPASITAEGIYEVTVGASEVTMQYEIAQTQPDIGVTKPTPEGGFGSTANGAIGTANVQNYVKID